MATLELIAVTDPATPLRPRRAVRARPQVRQLRRPLLRILAQHGRSPRSPDRPAARHSRARRRPARREARAAAGSAANRSPITRDASPREMPSAKRAPDSRPIRLSTDHCASVAGRSRHTAEPSFELILRNRADFFDFFDMNTPSKLDRSVAAHGRPSLCLRNVLLMLHLVREASPELCAARERHPRLYLGPYGRRIGWLLVARACARGRVVPSDPLRPAARDGPWPCRVRCPLR